MVDEIGVRDHCQRFAPFQTADSHSTAEEHREGPDEVIVLEDVFWEEVWPGLHDAFLKSAPLGLQLVLHASRRLEKRAPVQRLQLLLSPRERRVHLLQRREHFEVRPPEALLSKRALLHEQQRNREEIVQLFNEGRDFRKGLHRAVLGHAQLEWHHEKLFAFADLPCTISRGRREGLAVRTSSIRLCKVRLPPPLTASKKAATAGLGVVRVEGLDADR
eukprot:scaffold1476_cov264-Pinguiococcus_pyrenoidosus.AAC.5